MDTLIKNNYLNINDCLYSPKKEKKCKILESGKVQDFEGEKLSIHKMSAKILNKSNHNGWSYFYVNYKEDFIPLDQLRYIYTQEQNAR